MVIEIIKMADEQITSVECLTKNEVPSSKKDNSITQNKDIFSLKMNNI